MKTQSKFSLMTFKLVAIFALFITCQIAFQSQSLADNIFRGMQVANDIDSAGIETLAGWNVNLVRYQLIWGVDADTASEAEYNAWLESELSNLDSLLPVFAANNIKVIPVLQSAPGGHYSYSPKLIRIFKEAWAQDAFVRIWQEIANRYKDNSTIWGYDIVNEPAYDAATANSSLRDWNELALHTAQKIREIDSNVNHRIVIESIYGDIAKMSRLKFLPVSVKGVVYSAHFYYPVNFLTQATSNSYPTKKVNKQKLLERVQPLQTFAAKYKKKFKRNPQIFIGEFSANAGAPGNSASVYLKDVLSIFHSFKYHWTFHAFREATVWSVEHELSNGQLVAATSETGRLKQLRKYFNKNRR